jgi:dipeptidyl aminopeptidase/acylaminoacyl peptidase
MQSSSFLLAAVITLTLWLFPSSGANVFAQTRINGKIAFSQVTQGSDSQINLVNDDGSGLSQIPGVCCGKNTHPRWSPDGTQIVLTSNFPDGNDEIYTMNADGSGRKRLTDNPAVDEFPAWSPDGTKIAFSSNRDAGAFHIYVMNADGTGQRRLTPSPSGGGDYPAWSSDGTRIAFSFIPLGGNFDIYVINVDGTGLKNITNDPGNDLYPSWSPDDSKIVFSSLRGNAQSVYVMNADGSNQTRLTTGDADDSPSWSPNGTKIVFSRLTLSVGNSDLFVMNSDGSNLIRVTTSSLHDLFPSWQPKLAPTFTPTLITEAGTDNALALDSVTLTRDPFNVSNANNLGQDQRARIMLFAVYTELMPGEEASAVTARAEDSQHVVHPLTVEYVGRVPGLAWLTQVNVRLPEELAGTGDVMVSISLHGTTSNKAILRIH